MSNYLKTITIVLTSFMNGCTPVEIRGKEKERTAACECEAVYDEVPGTIVSYSPASSGRYIGSPSIAVLPNGHYVASHDFFGPNSNETVAGITKVFVSSDAGKTWTERAEITGQFWSQLFVLGNSLYLMGTEKVTGDVVLRKSVDNGITWTQPVNGTSGRLVTGGKYHCAPTPVIVHQGRLWKGMEDVMGGGAVWGQSFRSFMMSVSDTADIMNAGNWRISNRMPYNAGYLNGDFGGWLEGNAVVAPDGSVVNLLRTHYVVNGDELMSQVKISPDGTTATFDPDSGFVGFPGGCKKFVVRRDPSDSTYWSLSNYVPDNFKGGNPERTRNTLALLKSSDLVTWEIRGIVLHHPDVTKHGFQYPDFQFDGNDILCVSRTAYDDASGGADNQHNANYLTFHRIKNYRTYSTPVQWSALF